MIGLLDGHDRDQPRLARVLAENTPEQQMERSPSLTRPLEARMLCQASGKGIAEANTDGRRGGGPLKPCIGQHRADSRDA